MVRADNKEVVRCLVNELWNQGDSAAVARYVAITFRNHNPNLPFVSDRDSLARWALALRASFPDLTMRLEELVAEGDLVCARWAMRGTHRGMFNGLAPTGRAVSICGVTSYRLAAGLVVECWWSLDVYSLLQQLGAFTRTMPM